MTLALTKLSEYIQERISEFDQIGENRRSELIELAKYAAIKIKAGQLAKIVFVCTHNSRRSQISQVWGHVAAWHFGLPLESFSAGTEVTAFHPNAVDALRRCGLDIECDDAKTDNPIYLVRTTANQPPLKCFSKVLRSPANPGSGFCAVMTCSHADESCPLVPGCEQRLPIRYEDPKIADGTELQTATYDDRTRQISRELLFMASFASELIR